MGRAQSETFDQAVARISGAIGRITSGEAKAYIDCWAQADEVTLFGAWGPIERGHQTVADTFAWVGRRFSGPGLQTEIATSSSRGDFGYTVGFERGAAGIDGGPEQAMTIRVTHVYRREDPEWKLVHRHADIPPMDPRTTKAPAGP
jgi:ketosteroid isomerase-like protein